MHTRLETSTVFCKEFADGTQVFADGSPHEIPLQVKPLVKKEKKAVRLIIFDTTIKCLEHSN